MMLVQLKETDTMSKNKIEADETRKVRFSGCDAVLLFQPIVDPDLKNDLYYSSEELYIIRKRFEMVIALHRQAVRARRLDEELQAKKANFDAGRKRSLHLGKESPAAMSKRRRTRVTCE
jgi:hypothetical protein